MLTDVIFVLICIIVILILFACVRCNNTSTEPFTSLKEIIDQKNMEDKLVVEKFLSLEDVEKLETELTNVLVVLDNMKDKLNSNTTKDDEVPNDDDLNDDDINDDDDVEGFMEKFTNTCGSASDQTVRASGLTYA